MTIKDYIDSFLKLIEIIASWPVLLLVSAVVFYPQIKPALPELLSRLRKAPGGWEFDELKEVKQEIADLANTSQIQIDRGIANLKFDPNAVKLSHSAKAVDAKYWRVRVRLDAPDEFLTEVKQVIFERHPTFRNRFKEVNNAPFEDSFKCWGAFTIRAEIKLENGQVLKRQRFLTLESQD